MLLGVSAAPTPLSPGAQGCHRPRACWRCHCSVSPLQMVRHQKAVVIQAAVRGWLARSHYARLRGAVLYLQCCYRRARARRELRRLRAEARSVEHYKQLHKGMEIKVMQLQCRLDEQVGAAACFGTCLCQPVPV